MKTVYLGFSTSRRWKPFSALLKWWWDVPYSHVYLRWPTPWGFDEVLEASSSSVSMVEYETWKKKNKVVEELKWEISREEWDKVMRELRAKTGTPYGYSQLLSMAIAELFRLDESPWGDGDASWVCSELAYKFLIIIGVEYPSYDIDSVTPKDVWDMVHR